MDEKYSGQIEEQAKGMSISKTANWQEDSETKSETVRNECGEAARDQMGSDTEGL